MSDKITAADLDWSSIDGARLRVTSSVRTELCGWGSNPRAATRQQWLAMTTTDSPFAAEARDV